MSETTRVPGPNRRLAFLALACCLLAMNASAQEASQADHVVRMLEADLSEGVILGWLEAQRLPAEPLSADDLVALKAAGASDDLMMKMLDRSKSAEAAGESGEPMSTPAPTPVPPSVPVPPPARASGDGAAQVFVRVSYLPFIDEYTTGTERPWDLYIYIDGIPATYLPPGSLQNRAEVIEFVRQVPEGSHTIRVAQERHYRRDGRWQHETRAAEPSFTFDLGSEPARLEVEFEERLMDHQDPLVFKLTQGETVLDSGRVGGDSETWPALCQDIEASVPKGKKPNRRQRQRLEDCLDWSTWWGGARVPPRAEVLEAMAGFDFRPRPKGS